MTSPLQPSFIQALRAFAALTILSHHFALYAPLSEWASPLLGDLLSWLAKYARATQVFFVVSGFMSRAVEVTVGGATVFVLDVDKFIKL